MTEQQPTEQIKPKVTGKPTGKPFVKGDPRINRKGRPKSFDALRALAQQVANEEVLEAAKDGEEPKPLVIEGHIVTRVEYILRQWAESKEPQLQKAFIEIAYGKVPDQVDVKNSGVTILRIVYEDKHA